MPSPLGLHKVCLKVRLKLQIWRRVLYQKISALPFVSFISLFVVVVEDRLFPFAFPSVELVMVPYFPYSPYWIKLPNTDNIHSTAVRRHGGTIVVTILDIMKLLCVQ